MGVVGLCRRIGRAVRGTVRFLAVTTVVRYTALFADVVDLQGGVVDVMFGEQ